MLAFTLPASSLTVRGYDAKDHDRFTGFPAAPVMNPDFLYDASKFTGVGWWVNTATSAGTLYSPVTAVSPRHLLTATHAAPPIGTAIHFIDSAGNLVTRTLQSNTVVPDDSSGGSDLCVMTLADPLPATIGHYPWQNLIGGEPAYLGQILTVLGQHPNGTPRAGRAVLDALDDEDDLTAGTYEATWTYSSIASPPNDCGLSPGDSGGPGFAMVGEQPALVGVHSAVATVGPVVQSFEILLAHYAPRVDTILAPTGHRLAPANFTATTLQFPSAAVGPIPLRRSSPGSISFSVANTGSSLTGNLALRISFPAGSEPSMLTADDWVVKPDGTGAWNLRAATLAAGASLSFTATWTDLPAPPSITVNLSADSDTADAIVAAPAFSLAPSYAEWSEGLAMPGQTGDPDEDDLENLLEYALGGDPMSGAMFLTGDHPLQPVITGSDGTIILSFPERSDAVLRGLSYVVETSANLGELPASTALPAGASTSAAPFDPEVPGFVKRTITWPSDAPQRFARLKVELAE